MSMIQHPATWIAAGIAESLELHAAESEALQTLHPAQLHLIQANNWFRLFVPTQYGGLGYSLPEALRLEEALAWADGSVGWTVTLCAGAGWFCGYLDPALSSKIFDDEKVCIAGSGKASGSAAKVEGGYLVTGEWDYATGSNHATAFTANCMVTQRIADAPAMRSFLFLRDEVTVMPNWKRIGMQSTGSNSFAVSGVFVPDERCFIIDPRNAILDDPIYQFPFLPFAETTLAVNSSGMAMRFLDLCRQQFEVKSTPAMQLVLAEAMQKMAASRQLFYRFANAAWVTVADTKILPLSLADQLSKTSKALAICSRQVVDELYPLCGMQAANPDTTINRVWRNLHTASQHSIFNG